LIKLDVSLKEYLLSSNWDNQIDLVSLASLSFELTEEEDDAYVTKNKTTILRLIKVLIYYIGLIDKKYTYTL